MLKFRPRGSFSRGANQTGCCCSTGGCKAGDEFAANFDSVVYCVKGPLHNADDFRELRVAQQEIIARADARVRAADIITAVRIVQDMTESGRYGTKTTAITSYRFHQRGITPLLSIH